MTDMIERVARGISASMAQEPVPDEAWAGLRPVDRETMLNWASAAIEAMREPSEAMVEAVVPCPAHWDIEGPDGPAMNAAIAIDRISASKRWQAMIDAALTGKG